MKSKASVLRLLMQEQFSLIEFDNVFKIYRQGLLEVPALQGVSFFINVGEFVAIMGPSGSGKSTAMNLLGCLDRPTSGVYRLEGQNVNDLNDNQLAKIRNERVGFVFQTFNLLPRTSALENVELPLIYSSKKDGNKREIASSALKSVGLGHRLKHRPNELSGGEQQRVAIARALVNSPSIILADEPTGNLDTKSSIEIMKLFQRLNDSGITIILVTHEEDISLHTKRRLRFLDGKIISDDLVKNRIVYSKDELESAVSLSSL